MIVFFHLSGRKDKIPMPVAYQSIMGKVACHIVTKGNHLTLTQLIAHLNSSFRVGADEDTLSKELYIIKQDPWKSVYQFYLGDGTNMLEGKGFIGHQRFFILIKGKLCLNCRLKGKAEMTTVFVVPHAHGRKVIGGCHQDA